MIKYIAGNGGRIAPVNKWRVQVNIWWIGLSGGGHFFRIPGILRAFSTCNKARCLIPGGVNWGIESYYSVKRGLFLVKFFRQERLAIFAANLYSGPDGCSYRTVEIFGVRSQQPGT
jgi:hypothetical protein